MKAQTLLVAVVACAMLVSFEYNASRPPPPKLNWSTDLDAALKEAKTSHRLVLVDFTASWCPGCQQYLRDVFPTESFKRETRDLILVDVDVDAQRPQARKYRIDPLPDVRIYSPNGAELARVIGYDPDLLQAELSLVQEKASRRS